MITERKTDLDVLKIIAALFVVGVHVSATAMDLVTEYSADWMLLSWSMLKGIGMRSCQG